MCKRALVVLVMMVVVEMGPGVFMHVDVFMLMIVTNWCVVNTNRVKPFLKFELVMMVVKLLEGQGLAMKEVYLFGL